MSDSSIEPIVVSWSEIDAARQCPHKHRLAYVDRWRSGTTSPALSRGIVFHEVMEAHYRFVRSWQLQPEDKKLTDDQIQRYIMEYGLDEWAKSHPAGRDHMKTIWPLLHEAGGSQTPDQELIWWMLAGYLIMYGFDQHWEIVAVEHSAEYVLPELDGSPSRYRIKTKIDLIVYQKFRGIKKLILIDHKSGKDLPSRKELEFDDQFGLYNWLLKQVGKKPFQSVYNAVRTQRNKDDSFEKQPLDTRMSRTPISREDGEMKVIADEALETVKLMYEYYADRPAPRTPNTETCKWKCDMKEPCLASRKGIDERQFLMTAGFVQDFTRH